MYKFFNHGEHRIETLLFMDQNIKAGFYINVEVVSFIRGVT